MDVGNFIKNKASILKTFHTDPNFLDNMPMWEYELLMKEVNSQIEEENKAQEEQMRASGIDPKNPGGSFRNMARAPSISMGSMPSTIKMPSIGKM